MYVDWKTRTITISISIWRTVYGGIQLLWHLCKYHKIAEEEEEEKENYHLSDHSNKKRSAAKEEEEVTKKKITGCNSLSKRRQTRGVKKIVRLTKDEVDVVSVSLQWSSCIGKTPINKMKTT